MILIGKYYAQLSLGKHHPTADRSKYRDLQLYIINILQILVRDLETLILVWDVSLKSLPSVVREPCGRGGRKYKSHRGWRTPKLQDPLNQHGQSSDAILETEAACTEPVWACPKPSVFRLWPLI